MKLAVLHLGFIILIAGFVQVGARSQTPARPEFDVVSIKRSQYTSTGALLIGAQSNPGTVTLAGINPGIWLHARTLRSRTRFSAPVGWTRNFTISWQNRPSAFRIRNRD